MKDERNEGCDKGDIGMRNEWRRLGVYGGMSLLFYGIWSYSKGSVAAGFILLGLWTLIVTWAEIMIAEDRKEKNNEQQ